MTPAEVKAVVLEALAEYDRAKKKAKPKVATLPYVKSDMDFCYQAWETWFGTVNYGRFAKALSPVLRVNDVRWVHSAIIAYGKRAHQDGKPQFYSPERFAQGSVHYILPCIPSNELTEAEAVILGPEMVASRAHMETLGLLTRRATG